MTEATTRAERIAKLRADEAAESKKDADVAEENELQKLELRAKYRAELGKYGVDFVMVDATAYGCGFIVIKLGEDLSFRKYLDAAVETEGAVDAADCFDFVGSNIVFPDQQRYAEIARKHGFIHNQCAEALAELHGTKAKKVEGK